MKYEVVVPQANDKALVIRQIKDYRNFYEIWTVDDNLYYGKFTGSMEQITQHILLKWHILKILKQHKATIIKIALTKNNTTARKVLQLLWGE